MNLGNDTSQTASLSWWGQLCNLVKHDDVESINKLLDDQQRMISSSDAGEKTLTDSPLHTAVLEDKVGVLKLLLSRGLEVAVTNLYGQTPLHLACRFGKTEMVGALLKAGADINAKDCGECTPLFHAVYSSQADVVDQLIQAGCNLDTLNEDLITPLDHAVMYKQAEITSLLLKGGCAIDKSAGLVYYPGHYANSLLFSLWADSDVANIETMIHAGYRINHSQVVKLLQVAEQLALDDRLLIHVKEMISRPRSLAGCCRISVRLLLLDRKFVTGESLEVAIQKLPLPARLKEYLCLR